MKHLGKHIDEFENLMHMKGFDGHFLCNSNFPGKLKDSLSRHLREVLQEEIHVRPFYLTTYSLWKDKESPYVQCDLKVKYDENNGFKVDTMEARYVDRSFNPLRTLEVRLTDNEDMPTREKVNSTVGPRKKRRLKL